MNTTIQELYSDIWEYVFEYFNANELFFSFTNVNEVIDGVLMHNKSRFLFRGLILDLSVLSLPESLRLNQVSSLELHDLSPLDVIQECRSLRSLKLFGGSAWIVSVLSKVSRAQIAIEHLILTTLDVDSLATILASVAAIPSLIRLEVYANESDERLQMGDSILTGTNIQRFTLHTCSSISWDDLSFMIPSIINIRSLDITLSRASTLVFPSAFLKLRYIRLRLHELPFESIWTLLYTMRLVKKLKLTGLVDDQEFLAAHNWISLFTLCPYLNAVTVHLSLEGDAFLFRQGIIQRGLQQINLNLKCLDDDNDCYHPEKDQQRWWTLSGMIMKHHTLSEKNSETFQ